MATWHQKRAPFHIPADDKWRVVMDPPFDLRAVYETTTRDLAEVYLRNLSHNRPGIAAHSYIAAPRSLDKEEIGK